MHWKQTKTEHPGSVVTRTKNAKLGRTEMKVWEEAVVQLMGNDSGKINGGINTEVQRRDWLILFGCGQV